VLQNKSPETCQTLKRHADACVSLIWHVCMLSDLRWEFSSRGSNAGAPDAAAELWGITSQLVSRFEDHPCCCSGRFCGRAPGAGGSFWTCIKAFLPVPSVGEGERAHVCGCEYVTRELSLAWSNAL